MIVTVPKIESNKRTLAAVKFDGNQAHSEFTAQPSIKSRQVKPFDAINPKTVIKTALLAGLVAPIAATIDFKDEIGSIQGRLAYKPIPHSNAKPSVMEERIFARISGNKDYVNLTRLHAGTSFSDQDVAAMLIIRDSQLKMNVHGANKTQMEYLKKQSGIELVLINVELMQEMIAPYTTAGRSRLTEKKEKKIKNPGSSLFSALKTTMLFASLAIGGGLVLAIMPWDNMPNQP
jgi:hypothetical protein